MYWKAVSHQSSMYTDGDSDEIPANIKKKTTVSLYFN